MSAVRRVLASLVVLQLLLVTVEITPSRSASCCCKTSCPMKRPCGKTCSISRDTNHSQIIQLNPPCVAPPASAALRLPAPTRVVDEQTPHILCSASTPETPPPRA
jgi:hypothetical protein